MRNAITFRFASPPSPSHQQYDHNCYTKDDEVLDFHPKPSELLASLRSAMMVASIYKENLAPILFLIFICKRHIYLYQKKKLSQEEGDGGGRWSVLNNTGQQRTLGSEEHCLQ